MPIQPMGNTNTGVSLYNNGNPSIGPMLTAYDISKAIVRETFRKPVWSQMAKRTNIRRNMGHTIKKRRRFPIMHKDNVSTLGVDAIGLTLVNDKWYGYTKDADGIETRTEYVSRALADAAMQGVNADGTNGRVVKGSASLYGQSTDFVLQNDAVPTLTELGGRPNIVGLTQILISGSIKSYNISEEFTETELLLGEANLVREKTIALGQAYATVQEGLVRNAVIAQALSNAVYAGGAGSLADVDQFSVLSYPLLRKFQTKLDKLGVPMETNIIQGSTRLGTVPLPSQRILYIPIDLESDFEDLTHNGVPKFKHTHEFASINLSADRDAKKDQFFGEIGAVGKFRIVSDAQMPYFAGAGADATDGTDTDGDGFEDGAELFNTTNGRYDAYPIVSVGSEAFEVLGLEGENIGVKYKAPSIIPTVDNTGEIGVMNIKWKHGMLFNKPEWINALVVVAKQ